MNKYTRVFVASCPNNGEAIIYTLTIEVVGRMIPVEHIVTATALIKRGYHEAIADDLFQRFGGHQILRAHHHGVDIETVRSVV
jgi:hypothetical protein